MIRKTENGKGAVIIGARHGPFGYDNPPILSLMEYAIGRRKVSASVAEAIQALNVKKPVIIISGPSGRTRLTAELWKQDLANAGFNVGQVILDERLTEVKNFSWALFEPLINGGNASINGTSFAVNKAETNPSNLSYQQYFMLSAAKSIPWRVKEGWPVDFRKKIESFETFGSIKRRTFEFLEDIESNLERASQVIFVTHDALLIQPVNVFTSGKKLGVDPAGFVQLGIEANKIVVRRVCDVSCDITTGNSNANILKALLK